MRSDIFLKRLRLYLSFYFNDKECEDIITDYEDYFRNEAWLLQENKGKMGYGALDPRILAKKIYRESYEQSDMIKTIISNVRLRFLGAIVLYSIVVFCMTYRCSGTGTDCLLVFMCMYAGLSISAMLLEKKDDNFNAGLTVGKLAVVFFQVLISVVVWLVVAFSRSHVAGIALNCTLYIVLAIVCIAFIVFSLLSKYIKRVIGYTIYFLGITMSVAYLIDQLHIFRGDITGTIQILRGSFVILLESFILLSLKRVVSVFRGYQ